MYDDHALDSALANLAAYGPDRADGLTSHVPMVAEALAALGRGDAIDPWIDRCRPLLLPRPKPATPIDPLRWREALGVETRVADWSAFFGAALREAPWTEVLARWSERLAPGIAAAATHGVIRTGHAARALVRRDTPVRREELAEALALWAAAYQPLPTAAGDRTAATDALRALARVERVPESKRRFDGTISGALAVLAEHAPFAAAIDLFDADRAPDAAIGDLSEAFARVFLANANDSLSAIVFTHGITSAAALRAIVPHLDAGAAREVIRFAWQTGAALYAAFATAEPARGEIAPPAFDRADWIERAVTHRDEHAIKILAACLDEYAIDPSPAYLAAAERALAMLPH